MQAVVLVLFAAAAAVASTVPFSFVDDAATPVVRALGDISVPDASFCNVLAPDGQKNLYVSRFRALGADSLSLVPDVGATLPTFASAKPVQISGTIDWPNDVSVAPPALFGGRKGIVAAGGFLVPGKTDGGLYFSESTGAGTQSFWYNLITTKGWFYHRVFFYDVNADGELDILTCRVQKPILGASKGRLVWLEPSNRAAPTSDWVEHEILAGCDALFLLADLDGDNKPEIIAPEYFSSKLQIYYSTDASGRFDNSSTVAVVTLDNSIGAPFDVSYIDINGDNVKDLLVTNHQPKDATPSGSVYAYEVPKDYKDVTAYTRHILADGFPVTQSGSNMASPGTATAFRPQTSSTGKMHIALAGDAAELAYILVPGTASWNYTVTELHNCADTVGKLAVDDVNGDGYTDIFVPCYNSGKVFAFTYAPAN